METVDGGTEETSDKPKELLEGSVDDAETGSGDSVSDDVNVTSHSQEEEGGNDEQTGYQGVDSSTSNIEDCNVQSDVVIASAMSADSDQLAATGQQVDEETGDKIMPDQEMGAVEIVEPSSVERYEDEEDVQLGIGSNDSVSYQASGDGDRMADDHTCLNTQESARSSNSKEEANKDIMEKDMDEEVDEFFNYAQVQQPVKNFPGLDNVDLASDEEGQDVMESKDEQNDDEKREDIALYDEQEMGPSGGEDPVVAGSVQSPFKDYPINIGNYKVCRQVGPGVKECIVLETGEQIKCFTNATKQPILLSQCSTTPIQNEPVSTSSPRPYGITTNKEGNYSSADIQQLSSVSAGSPNTSGNFEYMSFPDGSVSTIIAADTNLDDVDIGVQHEQPNFITGNGIPVILDNAEDDVKIGIQAEMDRLGKAIRGLQKSQDDLVGVDHESVEEAEELVGDVLSSGGDSEGGKNLHKDASLLPLKKSKRKRDKERFYVLQPDRVDDYEDLESNLERMTGNLLNANNNNNENTSGNDMDLEWKNEDQPPAVGGREEDDANNSANNTRRRLTDLTPTEISRNSPTRSPRSHRSGYHDDISWSRKRNEEIPERYSHYVTRGGSPYSSRLNNPYSRYDDASSLEASRLSTRYSLLDRGQHNSSPDSGSKQGSWHEMFKMIEEQHRTQQQQQYLEHQRILQEMQDSMKQELSKQQDTLKDRLSKYHEMLEELSLGRNDEDRGSNPSPSSQEDYYRDTSTSRTTLDGVPISLRYPPPLLSKPHHNIHDSEEFEESVYDQTPVRTPVKRSLEKELRSPPRPADTTLSTSQVSSLEGDKQLRGGVYSSPMPLAKAKPKGSPKASKLHEKASHHSHVERISYPAATQDNKSHNANPLAAENACLRERCQDLEDACHDRKIEIRELTQKIQGLERRAGDCSERFETAQTQVVSLHTRLEELTEYAKERDCVAADMEIKAKKSSESLQSAHKREKELTDSLQAAKITIRKLVEKYEIMEKDHQLLKDSHKDQEEALYASRKEVREVNNKMSRMELENKQLVHEKDVVKHELTMARSSPTKTNFEDALQTVTGQRRNMSDRRGPESRSVDRVYRSLSCERNKNNQELSPPESEGSDDAKQSPIMRAEKELQKLRESMMNGEEFAPKLQRKFYGTDMPRSPAGCRGHSVSSRHQSDKTGISIHAPKSSSPRDNKGMRVQSRDLNGRQSAPAGPSRSAKMTKNSEPDRFTSAVNDKRHKKTAMENGMSGEQAVERVKAGEIISRPAWEDMYTSMAPARGNASTDKKLGGDMSKAMRELSLRERLQSIENLERKYDDLISEKRKYESALSRVRGQSQHRDKERLESELDRVDRDLGSIRMSLKRFHVLKSSI